MPKEPPIIRDKAPTPSHYIRADGTEEICVSDILIVVPRASASKPQSVAPEPRPRASSTGEIDAGDILSSDPACDIPVEVAAPVFRPPAFSVHATQEILADDVLEVKAVAHGAAFQPRIAAQAPQPPASGREEAPSAPPPPWTIDVPGESAGVPPARPPIDAAGAMDEFDFPTQLPVMSGPYPSLSTGPRLTNFSATEVFRRRNHGMKLVAAIVAFAAAVMVVAGVARIAPSLGDGPVGIAVHSPKSLDKSVRTRDRIVGVARTVTAVTVSIDDLAPVRHRF